MCEKYSDCIHLCEGVDWHWGRMVLFCELSGEENPCCEFCEDYETG